MTPEHLKEQIAEQFPGADFGKDEDNLVLDKEGQRTVRIAQKFRVGDETYTSVWTPPRPDRDDEDAKVRARRMKQRKKGLI